MKNNTQSIGKKLLKGLAILLLLFVVIIMSFSLFLTIGKDRAYRISLQPLNLEQVSDGTYKGSYHGYRFSNTVKVTVKEHYITDIETIKPVLFMDEKIAADLTEKVKTSQNLEVDIVSGATCSSKAMLKAIENAVQ